MRAALSLFALAASALAANIPRDGHYEWSDGQAKPYQPEKWCNHGECQTKTTHIIVTYTTICPVTSTVTEPGHTYKTTYTTTSTVKKVVPTTIVVTKTKPPVTKTEGQGRQHSRLGAVWTLRLPWLPRSCVHDPY